MPCPLCGNRCAFFCTVCYVPVGAPPNTRVPRLRLPLKVDIIFKDSPSKSSAIHARVLCPDDVVLVPFGSGRSSGGSGGGGGGGGRGKGRSKKRVKRGASSPGPSPAATAAADDGGLPDYDPETTVLVFPSDDAQTFPSMPPADVGKVRKIVLIDTTWQRAGHILSSPKLKGLPRVKLHAPPPVGRFWRVPTEGVGLLSTIEALHLILKDYTGANPTTAAAEGAAAEETAEEGVEGSVEGSVEGNALSTVADQGAMEGKEGAQGTEGTQGTDPFHGTQGTSTEGLDGLLFFFEIMTSKIHQAATAKGRAVLPMDEGEKEKFRGKRRDNAYVHCALLMHYLHGLLGGKKALDLTRTLFCFLL